MIKSVCFESDDLGKHLIVYGENICEIVSGVWKEYGYNIRPFCNMSNTKIPYYVDIILDDNGVLKYVFQYRYESERELYLEVYRKGLDTNKKYNDKFSEKHDFGKFAIIYADYLCELLKNSNEALEKFCNRGTYESNAE